MIEHGSESIVRTFVFHVLCNEERDELPHSPFMGGLDSDHERSLAPPPLNQTNAKLDMPELKTTSTVSARCVGGSTVMSALRWHINVCGSLLRFPPNPILLSSFLFYTQFFFFHCM